MTMQTIGVVGAGVMGSDIALDLSIHNYRVILKDLTEELLEKAKKRMKRSYGLVKMMKPETCSSSYDEVLSRISFTLDYDGFDEADIIIENAVEKYKVKERVFTELGGICGNDTLLGTNTSCISVTKLGTLTPHPQNVVGMHFMNPAPLKPFVEVIKGEQTSDDAVSRTKSFLKDIGKSCIVVSDAPGFVSNRVLMVTINECIRLVQDKVADPKDVDGVFKLGFGHKMGPLATADLIGLDTIFDSLIVLRDSYDDSKYEPCELLQKMVADGLLGVKSGRGFFGYSI